MINFIPIFPLAIVVYPGETLNLHIFEEGYKELINECRQANKAFGIPAVINDKVSEFGTLVRIKEVAKVYDDGKMDIRTEGTDIFKILEVIKHVPDKMYSGAIVDYPSNNTHSKPVLLQQVLKSIRELHTQLNISKKFSKPDTELSSYDIAHHAGLSINEEYELLGLYREDQRLEYLKRHLNKLLPMLGGIEKLKEKIQMNGHFRELKGFNFDF